MSRNCAVLSKVLPISDRIRGLPAHRHVISATIYAFEEVFFEARNIPNWQLFLMFVISSQLAQGMLHFVMFQCEIESVSGKKIR